MKHIEPIFAGALIVLSILVAIVFTVVATDRALTALEGTLLQVFSLASGLAGSFIFGRASARSAAREFIKPHARSAFRRLISLFKSLSRVATDINASVGGNAAELKSLALRLQAIVVEQIATADDALEDWRDIVPEDVEELKAALSDTTREQENG
jgi:hypothetical protein